MATEERDATSLSRDRANGGESWSTTNSHEGAAMKKKRFVAPICHCGTYAILFESSTQVNPIRLFFGCSYFKGKGFHCKYFAWLDEYVASCHSNDGSRALEVEDPMKIIEERMTLIEMKMGDLNKRKKNIVVNYCKGIGIFLLGTVFALCLSIGFSSISNE
ncbi:hypothetical protein PIB30_097206 [Stylosanthes scabra]|uniref:GRF-type domain-containing protein n=1 Tax=Stylosanthes scabra TaxID=79078 RepID=A0ABU6XYQ7_9FABA|nr:hypothetical protein [Stylosanthes scabra]